MSKACDACRQPGACCSGFQFTRRFVRGTSAARIRRHLREGTDARGAGAYSEPLAKLPFEPVEESDWRDPEDGHARRWIFDCPKLDPEGRCTIYRERPQLCRRFRPKSSPLCVEFKAPDSETASASGGAE